MNSELIKRWLRETDIIMKREKNTLISMDGIFGDGDLGLTMSDGFTAAYDSIAASTETDCGKLLYTAGKSMGRTVPSTMGTLMASGMMEAGKQLQGKTELVRRDITVLFSAFFEGVSNRGKAKVGDKTFLDGLYPAVETLKYTENEPLDKGAEKAWASARTGFESTKGLLAVQGRAATRGEESRKIPDPGAAVAVYIMEGFYHAVS